MPIYTDKNIAAAIHWLLWFVITVICSCFISDDVACWCEPPEGEVQLVGGAAPE